MNVYSMKNWGESANFVGRKFLTISAEHIFCRDLDNYMRWLETAQYDRG